MTISTSSPLPLKVLAVARVLERFHPSMTARRQRRQVNFRLSARQCGEPAHAAERMNLRPTAPARLLAIRGGGQILSEAQGRA